MAQKVGEGHPKAGGKDFTKGHPRYGGRKKGQRNHVTVELKQLLTEMVPGPELEKMFWKYLRHRDVRVSIKAFELMLHYRFGKPVQPLVGVDEAPAININVSAIPQFRVPVKK